MKWILESERLGFREITKEDFTLLCPILQDGEIMYAWEHGFTESEVRDWIEKNISRYASDGFSYYAAIRKTTGELIGMMGPLIENIQGRAHIGVAYILDKKYWGQGYATEGAKACMEFAFSHLHAENVIAEIRPENLPSRKVAERLGMRIIGAFMKEYNGRQMKHLIYSKKSPDT